MRVGVVQFNPRLLDVEGNVDAVIRLIGRKRSDLMVLPELFNTGYNFRNRKELESVAEAVPTGPTTQVLRDLSKRSGMMIVAGLAEHRGTSSLMLKGAEVIAHPSTLVLYSCPEAMKTRALENRVYTVTADRVGAERGLRYIGQSEIVNPQGQIIYRASATREECVVRKIDLAMARNKTVTSRNNLLRDRTPRAYAR
jgi:predicted amidohydrolase